MLTITSEAKKYALDHGGLLHLDYIVLRSGCCIPYQPEPSVKLGKPRNPDQYREEEIDGVMVLVPLELPDVLLTISMTSFMGFRRLVIEGWKHL